MCTCALLCSPFKPLVSDGSHSRPPACSPADLISKYLKPFDLGHLSILTYFPSDFLPVLQPRMALTQITFLSLSRWSRWRSSVSSPKVCWSTTSSARRFSRGSCPPLWRSKPVLHCLVAKLTAKN